MAIFYCVISFQFFIYTDGFNPFYIKQFPIIHRYIGISLLAACLLLLTIFAYFQDIDWKARIKAVFEISLVSFFCFLYYAINSKQSILDLTLFNYTLNINTGLITLPLIILIFFTVQNSLTQNTNKTFLLVLQVLLIFLSIFSIDSILSQDRNDFRGFNNAWFSTLFSIQPEVWTILGLFLISSLTVFWLKLKDLKELIIQSIVFFFINLQVFFLLKMITINSFGFWHRALLMIIIWDIFYYLFRVLNKNTPSSDLLLRINLSLFYHAFLMFILVIVSVF